MRTPRAVRRLAGLAFTSGLAAALWFVASARDRPAPSELGPALPCNGHFAARGVIGVGDTRRWQLCYRAGGLARVSLAGGRTGDLDCYVYDTRRRLVARDDTDANGCVVTWSPTDSGDYLLEVVNVGADTGSYSAQSL